MFHLKNRRFSNVSGFKIANIVKVRKKAKIRNRYNQAPHLTKDTTWESNKNTIHITHKIVMISLLHKQFYLGQQLLGPGRKEVAVESYYKSLQRISTAYKALVSISPPYSCADPGIFVRGGGGRYS